MKMKTLQDLKVGDRAVRHIGVPPRVLLMPMIVTAVSPEIITCVPDDPKAPPGVTWTFSAENGGEIDEDLGWTADMQATRLTVA